MRHMKIVGGAFALVAMVLGLASAQTKPGERYDVKGDAGSVQGAIVKTFSDEKLIELKIEKVLSGTEGRSTDDNKKMDEKTDTTKMGGLRDGQIVYVHVADARVLDDKGVEQKRDDKSAWFTKDAGWSILKNGKRVKVEFSGTHEIPAPRDFPRDARAGGNILVYHATMIQLLDEK